MKSNLPATMLVKHWGWKDILQVYFMVNFIYIFSNATAGPRPILNRLRKQWTSAHTKLHLHEWRTSAHAHSTQSEIELCMWALSTQAPSTRMNGILCISASACCSRVEFHAWSLRTKLHSHEWSVCRPTSTNGAMHVRVRLPLTCPHLFQATKVERLETTVLIHSVTRCS